MTDKKESDPSSIGGPSTGPSTTNATSDSKMSKPMVDTKMQDSGQYDASKGLDDLVMGGCSTCGSTQHDTVECDSEDAQPEYMMSGALQTDMGSSTCDSTTGPTTGTATARASSTAAPDETGGQAQSGMPSGMPSGQDGGRRRSV